MSVWRDMGFLADGSAFGVDPGTFLSTAYGFWALLREKSFPAGPPSMLLPPFGFAFRRKSGDNANWWSLLGEYLSFPDGNGFQQFARPVPVSVWETAPDWPTTLFLLEPDILGEQVVPCPYSFPFRDVMSPDWPEQRRKLIDLARYAVVPLAITIRRGAATSAAEYISYSFQWFENSAIEASFPAYWQQATSRKVGVFGEKDMPIAGNFWQDTAYSFSYTQADIRSQTLWIYGAVDLATHPDFAEFYDIA